MLENLLKGSEHSKVVLIEDTVKQSGHPITSCFLKLLSTRYDQVHVLLFDPTAECLRNIPLEETKSRCIYHNLYSDPLNWLGRSDVATINTDFIDYLQQNILSSSVHNIAVVICSLTSLIIHRSPAYTCQFLQKLGNKHSAPFPDVSVGQVVSLVHQELHNEYTLKQLRYVSTSVISLLEDSSVNHSTNCNVVHRKISGKIFRTKEQYQLLSNFDLKAVKELQKAANIRPIERPQVDPSANLTFKLNLSDTEKVARSQQVLPHIQIQNRQQELQASTRSGQGQIFYEPDDADDFDDEDPDDDLDI